MAIFPQGGINCRNRSRLTGVSETACASRDRDPAVIKWALMSDSDDIHYEDSTKNVFFAQYYCKTRYCLVCYFTTLKGLSDIIFRQREIIQGSEPLS